MSVQTLANSDALANIDSLSIDSLSISKLHVDTVFGTATNPDLITFDNHLGHIFWGGVGSVIFYLLIMGLLAVFFYKNEKAMNFCERYLTSAFVLVWIAGFVIYNIGMYPEHEADTTSAIWALLGVAPMAIIHAFGMFLLQNDISAIHEECYINGWFMFFFSITHLLAAFISMVFIIRHFGFNIVASIIRYWKTNVSIKKKSDLYVFWGMNDATYYLAKDIIENGKGNEDNIVIIRIYNDTKDDNKLLGVDRLFNFLSLTKRKMEGLQKLQKRGCLTVSTYGSVMNSMQATDNENLLHKLRLNSISRLINHTTNTVHMFFLEEDEAFNIQAVTNLKNDKEMLAYAKKGKVRFYCHARYNSIHKVIEDEQAHKNLEVRVVDSSHICVEELKQDGNLHPVNYVDVEKDATVSSPFHALVVGFGEVGLDVVRFLYEFGAFVKTGSTAKKVERSEFRCHVLDKNMNEKAGLFYANAPSIKTTQDNQDDKQAKEINLYNMDCQSIDFYRRLTSWIKTLNYVVLVTENDELNISLAIRILRLAIRHRDNLDKFRIVVRVQHDENDHIQRVANHYNRLCAAENNSTDTSRLEQNKISSDVIISAPITLFGATKKAYSFKEIVSDALRNEAKKFKIKYDQSLNAGKKRSGKEPDKIESWDEEKERLMQLTGKNIGCAPTYSGVMRLRRIQTQNICNSQHKETKVRLAQRALNDKYEEILQGELRREDQQITYVWKDNSPLPPEYQRVLDVLAQTEHLRWNASHEILGYSGTNDAKDEATLLHDYLKDWQYLTTAIQSYDYNVVDVSLNISNPNTKV